MAVNRIELRVEASDIVADEGDLNVEKTLALYCEKLAEQLALEWPEAVIDIHPAPYQEVGTIWITADDDDKQEVYDAIEDIYNRGGFYVLTDGTIV